MQMETILENKTNNKLSTTTTTSPTEEATRVFGKFEDTMDLWTFAFADGDRRCGVPMGEPHFLHELAYHGHQKPHFDLDVSAKDLHRLIEADEFLVADCPSRDWQYLAYDWLLDTIIRYIELAWISLYTTIPFPLKDVLVLDCVRSDKISFHIIIDGWYHITPQSAGDLHSRVCKLLNQAHRARNEVVSDLSSELREAKDGSIASFLDVSVYKTNQTFRIIGSCKRLARIPFKPIVRGTVNFPNLAKNFDHRNKLVPLSYEWLQRTLISDVVHSKALPETWMAKPTSFGLDANMMIDDSELTVVLQTFFNSSWARDPRTGADVYRVRSVKGRCVFLNRAVGRRYQCPTCDTDHGGDHPFLLVLDDRVLFCCRHVKEKNTTTGEMVFAKTLIFRIASSV